MKLSLSALETFLKQQCDALRTSMDAAEYKDYIIAMIFIKWANDNFAIQQKAYAEKLRSDYKDLPDISIASEIEENNTDIYSFYVPVEARWNIEIMPVQYTNNVLNEREKAQQIVNDPTKNSAEIKEAKEKIRECENLLEWRGLLVCTENIGAALTRALRQLELANTKTLDGVLKSINFNKLNGKGERILSDELLSNMIKDFNKYTFTEDNFEFPDLLGAAYEYLLKFFAESAGKKGGEFYTPAPVVELMGKILQPAQNASICDPTVGSGGLLINMKNFVEARYGSAKNLHICGQEVIDGTYKMCKMNMLFHGITDANIQLGDTLLHPKHVINGELEKFDIVVANPPFSQNYTKKDMEFTERFSSFWMNTKKQADFMFVQHMVAILKDDGRMAVVMPHGVLFRGGEEMRYRTHLINEGLLECIIGLPEGLFYGTGIPACILIINKKGASGRNGVFFINADREYKEGKNQNVLRPEDVEKISYVYLNKCEIEKYSRFVSKEELEKENYNCNIRRYIDNTPPAENQDVYAHLHGGVPAKEIEELGTLTNCYGNIEEVIFEANHSEHGEESYMNFAGDISTRDDIKTKLFNYIGYKNTRAEYDAILKNFWKSACKEISKLPETKDVYDLQKTLSSLFSEYLSAKNNPVLDEYQSRGAFAQYIEDLKSDFKSIAASGWNATLIPDEVILQSQAGDILEQLKEKKARRDEIIEKFEEVAKFDDDECDEEFDEDTYDVFPKKIAKEYKDSKCNLKMQLDSLSKEVKNKEGILKAYKKNVDSDNKEYKKELNNKIKQLKKDKSDSSKIEIDKLNKIIADIDEHKKRETLSLDAIKITKSEAEATKVLSEIETIKKLISSNNDKIIELKSQIDAIDTRLKHNDELDAEQKQLTKDINAIEKNLAEIAQNAREKISAENAKELILSIGYKRLSDTINEYLDSHIRKLQHLIEGIYDKYTVTLGTMISKRDKAVAELDSFMKELGYEC
ncbi:N-6 DNA methylase [Fibrobacter sp. UWB11]|uniref:N-6 DNA methylase n=1 Tax=Fibrobacter sp. UWB11 TaxID=1896202 RepID=UPI000925CC1E|nr:N-6 DNA methylase [Fibrobacter sp. UWB11]SIN90075.1 type I restriction enzyme M protein [Fibrobacter sp. UWB11]